MGRPPANALRLATLLVICALRASVALAQQTETETAPLPTEDLAEAPSAKYQKAQSGWTGLPIVTYAPETSLGIGAFGVHFFRLEESSQERRASSVAAVALYTLKAQLLAELIPELYWNEDRAHLWSKLDYRHYPNKFWKIGNRSPDGSEESYSEIRWRWLGRIGHAIRGPLFLYGHVEIISMELSALEPDGQLASGVLSGSQGGISVAVGPALVWDTRDHVLSPHTGERYSISLATAQPLLGSRYEFTTLVFDLRNYFPIIDEHTLATNFVFMMQDRAAPFYQLPKLGGAELLRGYYDGRFRDRNLMLLQTEYRLPLFWRFGAVAFAGLGGVAHTPTAFRFDAPEWSLGGGLRLLLNRDEKLNLRADFGVGRDSFGFYVNAGEVF